MTNREFNFWLKGNLQPYIQKALAESRLKNPALIYTVDWLAAIAHRETGWKVQEYILEKVPLENIWQIRGDYSQRKGEKERQYHGFGIWQIDIASFPDFVKSGAWKDPYKCCLKAIVVLEMKRRYLQQHLPQLKGEALERAITAAYNCGAGNVEKAIHAGLDIDHYTFGKDYSKSVFDYRAFYKLIM